MQALTPTDSVLERVHLIPDELVFRPQWLVWRAERDQPDDDPRKIPYQACRPHRRAKVNDASTWATFDDAVEAFASSFKDSSPVVPLTGIGYVFTADDPYIGIDLDDCVAGDDIHPEARRIIRALGGYAEISPSMTGVKIWTRGAIDRPGISTGAQRRGPWGGNIEIYRERRWFAVTGWELDQ